MPAAIDVLIPTRNRPAALAATLASLIGQTLTDFSVVISDQSDGAAGFESGEAKSVLRVLRAQGRDVELLCNRPRRGLAQQRQFLLDRALAPFVLFLDDDVLLEPDLLQRLQSALAKARCGFVGSAVIGLSYIDDVRPHQQKVEFWTGAVEPERIEPGSPEWQRHVLHSAANLWHVQRTWGATAERPLLYKIAWVGGCVLYDAGKLRATGAFDFWRDLPAEHCGEDVLAQLRVMARFGGCGLMPSGAYHQELPTTVAERSVDAPKFLHNTHLRSSETQAPLTSPSILRDAC